MIWTVNATNITKTRAFIIRASFVNVCEYISANYVSIMTSEYADLLLTNLRRENSI